MTPRHRFALTITAAIVGAALAVLWLPYPVQAVLMVGVVVGLAYLWALSVFDAYGRPKR